jgi:hypothetical protein
VSGNLAGLTRGAPRTPRAANRVPWSRLREYWLAPPGLVMLGVTVLALAIRLFTLTRPGYLTGVTEFDDGVYLGGSIRLLQGALPYHDFAYVQPPGILVLMTPVALLTKAIATTHAMAVARLITACASAACVPLAGSLTRHRGTLVTLVTCGVLAVYPADITTAHTLILEPWMNLFLLIGACLAFRSGRLASPRRLLWAGLAIGFAGAVKYWAALPFLVLLVLCLAVRPDRVRRTRSYLTGVAIGFAVPVLPFALTAPVAFVRSTLLDQATRAGSYVPVSMRLAHVTGLIDFLNSRGHLSLSAGIHSLFANGGAAATSTTSAGWPPFAVALVLIALVFAGYLSQHRRLSSLEIFGLVTTAAAVGAVMLYSAFFYHYPDFVAPWLALSAGGAAGALSRIGARAGAGATDPDAATAGISTAGTATAGTALLRKALFGFVGFILLVVAVFQVREVSGLRAPDIYPDQAAIPPGVCVVTDQISLTISADRFTAARPGCPDIMDSLAATLVLSNGVSVQGGAASLPKVVGGWQSILGKADYVWLSPNNSRRIPWTPGLSAWFNEHFTRLTAYRHGLGTVYKRVDGSR